MNEPLAIEEGEEVVRICIMLSNKDQQDDYVMNLIISLLNDEIIDAMVYKLEETDKPIRTPEKPYQTSIR